MKKIILLAFVFLLGVNAISVFAMSSTNYQINADSINPSGGVSSSASYKSFDSIGENFTGNMSSTNFTIGEGLAPMLSFSLTLNLDSNTKNLGTLTAGTPVSGTTTAAVTTDAWGGYDLYIMQNNDLKHSDGSTTISAFSCAIASPCYWSGTGFGFTINSGTSVESAWGTSPNYKYASIPVSNTLFHTKGGYMSGPDNTVIGYKIDVPVTQKAGTYNNNLTYTAIAKL